MIKRLHDEYVAAVDRSLVNETGDQVPSSKSKDELTNLELYNYKLARIAQRERWRV